LRSLLVTGGAGFIGANFVRYWRERNPEDVIVVLDALTYAGNQSNLHGVGGAEFIADDIRNTDRVRGILSDYVIDTIVHFAAESHVDRSIDGPDAFIDTNVVGTHSLLKAAKQVWLDQGSGSTAASAQTTRPFLKQQLTPRTPRIQRPRPVVITL
jgi:dTDP-glucose 4,6-dehydratase